MKALRNAGYHGAFQKDDGEEIIDMHGIAVKGADQRIEQVWENPPSPFKDGESVTLKDCPQMGIGTVHHTSPSGLIVVRWPSESRTGRYRPDELHSANDEMGVDS